MNNKTIIEFGFRIIRRIKEISAKISIILQMIRSPNSVIAYCVNTPSMETSHVLLGLTGFSCNVNFK